MYDDDILWRHLKRVPAFRALLRATESLFYQEVELPRPILDLGCGDGHFAQTTFTIPPEVGLDPSPGPLRQAFARQAYGMSVRAVGQRLPFKDGQFGTVICNSVLEHIPDVDAVMREAARVLRGPVSPSTALEPLPAGIEEESRGGLLILTVPSEQFTRFLSISSALRRVGLEPLASGYEDWFNRVSRHHHCDPPSAWHERLSAAGLCTIRWQYYFSRRAHRRLEWGHYLGLPALVSKLLLGRWIIAPWRSSLRWTELWLRPCFLEPPPGRGAYLLFAARRKHPGERVDSLPPPIPHDFSARLRPDAPSDAVTPAPVAVHAAEGAAAEGAGVECAPESEPQSGRPVAAPSTRSRAVIWLALAFVFAVVGQTSWNWHERPVAPSDGFTWYGLALLSLAVFIRRVSCRRLEAPAAGVSWETSLRWLRGQTMRVLLVCFSILLSWFAWLQVGDAVRPPGGPGKAMLLWVVSIGLATLALWPAGIEWLRARLRPSTGRARVDSGVPLRSRLSGSWRQRWEILLVAALFGGAFVLRFVRLADIPYVMAGDEASMGREAARVLSGELANPFITGWFSHPTLFFFLLALPIKFFGQTAFSARFLSPFVGAMTVVVTYLFARRAWGRLVAVLAAGLLAAYHFHIHYSRLALNNSWDPLFALLVMGLLWRGWQSGDRRYYVLGGLGLGISQYFYMGSRVLLVMVVGLIAYWLLTDRRRLWGQRGNLVAALLVTLVVGLPIALFSVSHPDDYFARVNQLGIYQSGWLQREMAMTGRAEADLLWEQGWKSALAFNYTVDTTFWYRPGIPLLRFWPSILFVFGLGLALAGARRTPNFALLLWIGATVVFAGVLLENPPSSQRYVIAAPAVCLLVALPLAWMAEQLRRLLGGRKEVWLGGVLLLGLWIARGDVSFYFADYTPHGDYGGLNTEVADRAADYLLDLGSEWQVYFYGPPRMGIERLRGFPTISYLVPEADPVDVWEPVTDTSQLPDVRRPAVFMFLPERAGELDVIRRGFPGGTEKHFPGRFDRMLFLAYEVP